MEMVESTTDCVDDLVPAAGDGSDFPADRSQVKPQQLTHRGPDYQAPPALDVDAGGDAEPDDSLHLHRQLHGRVIGGSISGGDDATTEDGFKREMSNLEEMLSKLNPMAEEFIPLSLAGKGYLYGGDFVTAAAAGSTPVAGGYYVNGFGLLGGAAVNGGGNRATARQKKIIYHHGRRSTNSRTSLAQREEVIRRTVYVSDIDQQVTEEQLAALFINCGQIVDCRICGDPKSVLRFAFIEFTDEEGARASLDLSGTMLGFYQVNVQPSKTAIAPVNPTYLPRSDDEREMCARTVYCTNIDKKVSQAEVKSFFELICGEVYRLRLLGDFHHSTQIAFVEFKMAESATAALNCSGVVLGSLPIRVSPSKTPVRPLALRISV